MAPRSGSAEDADEIMTRTDGESRAVRVPRKVQIFCQILRRRLVSLIFTAQLFTPPEADRITSYRSSTRHVARAAALNGQKGDWKESRKSDAGVPRLRFADFAVVLRGPTIVLVQQWIQSKPYWQFSPWSDLIQLKFVIETI